MLCLRHLHLISRLNFVLTALPDVQVCDATDVDSSNNAGTIKNILTVPNQTLFYLHGTYHVAIDVI
jgi:hypothetical protein